MKREYWYGLMLAFIVLIGVMTYDFHVTHKLIKQTRTEILEIHDTLVKTRVDSIFNKTPIYVKQTVLKRDTVQLWSPYEQDSVKVELPYIRKEYQDFTYRAWVSGFQDVNLDSIEIYQKTKTIQIHNTNYITKYKNRPFSVGIQTGYGYDFMNKRSSPFIGIGVQYNLFSFGKRK